MYKFVIVLLLLFLFFKSENFHVKPRVLKIMLIGGVHGNEPAGTYALYDLIEKLKTNEVSTRHELLIVPLVNKFGFRYNSRYYANTSIDLNREFLKSNAPMEIRKIRSLINIFQPDLIIDFHEGWGWHKMNRRTLGSTISPNYIHLYPFVINLVRHLNSKIPNSRKHYTAFSSTGNTGACGIDGTLACYCHRKQINHILVEITGQNNIQSMELRKNQIKEILNYILDFQYF